MKSNSTILVAITLFIAAGGYWYFFTQTGNQPPISASSDAKSASQAQFQALVGQLQSISFRTDILSDPRFTSLTDLATPIAPEPPGRLDPFAPLSAR